MSDHFDDEIIRRLKKPPQVRSDHDISIIEQGTNQTPFFAKYIEQNLSELHFKCCRYMTYEVFQPSSIVFKQGEIGSKFYIILKGRVGIFVENHAQNGHNLNHELIKIHGSQQEMKLIKELQSGDSFGELALLNEQPRSATVKCIGHEDCHLAVLEKKMYMSLFKRIFDDEIKRAVAFYPDIELFSSWNFNKIKEFYNHSFRIEVAKGERIIAENELVDAIYIITSGEFIVKKKSESINEGYEKEGQVNHENDEGIGARKVSQRPKELSNLKRKSFSLINSASTTNSLFILSNYEIFGQEDVEVSDQPRFVYSVFCESLNGSLIYIKLEDYFKIIMSDNSQQAYMHSYSRQRLDRVTSRLKDISYARQQKAAQMIQSEIIPYSFIQPKSTNSLQMCSIVVNSPQEICSQNSRRQISNNTKSNTQLQIESSPSQGKSGGAACPFFKSKQQPIDPLSFLGKPSVNSTNFNSFTTMNGSISGHRPRKSYDLNSISDFNQISTQNSLHQRADSLKARVRMSELLPSDEFSPLNSLSGFGYQSSYMQKQPKSPYHSVNNSVGGLIQSSYTPVNQRKTRDHSTATDFSAALKPQKALNLSIISSQQQPQIQQLFPLSTKSQGQPTLGSLLSIDLDKEEFEGQSQSQLQKNQISFFKKQVSRQDILEQKGIDRKQGSLDRMLHSCHHSVDDRKDEMNKQIEECQVNPLVQSFHDDLRLRFYNKFKSGQVTNLKSHLNSYLPISTLPTSSTTKAEIHVLENAKYLERNRLSQERKALKEYEAKLKSLITGDLKKPGIGEDDSSLEIGDNSGEYCGFNFKMPSRSPNCSRVGTGILEGINPFLIPGNSLNSTIKRRESNISSNGSETIQVGQYISKKRSELHIEREKEIPESQSPSMIVSVSKSRNSQCGNELNQQETNIGSKDLPQDHNTLKATDKNQEEQNSPLRKSKQVQRPPRDKSRIQLTMLKDLDSNINTQLAGGTSSKNQFIQNTRIKQLRLANQSPVSIETATTANSILNETINSTPQIKLMMDYQNKESLILKNQQFLITLKQKQQSQLQEKQKSEYNDVLESTEKRTISQDNCQKNNIIRANNSVFQRDSNKNSYSRSPSLRMLGAIEIHNINTVVTNSSKKLSSRCTLKRFSGSDGMREIQQLSQLIPDVRAKHSPFQLTPSGSGYQSRHSLSKIE